MTTRRGTANRALLAAALGSAGILASGFFNPQPSRSPGVRFPDTECGRRTAPRILVTYASEFGTTAEVAEVIASALCESGMHVVTKRVGDVTSLEGFHAVVVGGPIQFDNWMSEARRFVQDNETALAQLPVAYFFTCLTLAEQTGAANRKADRYANRLNSLSDKVNPVSIGRFGGALDYTRMNRRSTLVSKLIYAAVGVGEGDYRDWDNIDAWTRALASQVFVQRQ